MTERVMTIDEIRAIVSPIAEKYHIPAIFLFGSYARGTANPDSDIDLIIDTAGTQLNGMFALGMLYSDLEEALGKSIDLITLGSLAQNVMMESELRFRETVLKERVSLYAAA